MNAKKYYPGLSGVALAAALLIMPPALDAVGGLNSGASAHAKGGEGNGGGNGGGHGGGAQGAGQGGHGYGHAEREGGLARGHDKKAENGETQDWEDGSGSLADKFGGMNAYHAVLNALRDGRTIDAAANSQVYKMAQYYDVVSGQAGEEGLVSDLSGESLQYDASLEGNALLEEQAALLEGLAANNKAVDIEVVAALNGLLGLEPSAVSEEVAGEGAAEEDLEAQPQPQQ